MFGYLTEMLKWSLVAAPIFLLCRFCYWQITAKNQRINWYHEIGLLLFVCYLVGVGSITMNWYSLALSVASGNFGADFSSINLVPFRQIFAYGGLSDGFAVMNLLGNILLFVPVGFLVVLLWQQRQPLVAGALVALAFSLLIEFVQLFSLRGTDIDDVILNTAGGLVGAVICVLIKQLVPKLSAKYISKKS